jgi:hypothetical protein
MTRLTKTARAVNKRLAASLQTQRRIMKELVDFAHSPKNGGDFSAKPDMTHDAHLSRLNAHARLIEERGGYHRQEASLVLVNSSWETKERCALWLRTELKQLRDGEARVGTAPIRNRLALSRIQIAEAP